MTEQGWPAVYSRPAQGWSVDPEDMVGEVVTVVGRHRAYDHFGQPVEQTPEPYRLARVGWHDADHLAAAPGGAS